MNRLFNFVVISVVLFNFKVQCELPLCTRAGDLFSYKYDCNKYWECENDEDVILKNCPLGLEFNNSTKECDKPIPDGCKAVLLACSNNDLIANPDDCGSYFLCSNQRHVLMPCPNGLQWSSERKVCDWPERSDCGYL